MLVNKKSILVIVLLLWSLVGFSQKLPLNRNVKSGILPNGLTYYILKNSEPQKRAELRLVVNAGSILENDNQQGLAHLVEHLAFNGTKHFKKNQMVNYIESIGVQFGPHLNAYTSFDETVYMIQVPTDKVSLLDSGLLILSDWAGSVSFENKEIDKERGVVIEEWRLGLGAENRMQSQYWPKLFFNSRYAVREPIGKKEIIEKAPYKVLKQFYKDWYRPNLMAVVAVGDFDEKEIEAKIIKQFSSLKNPSKPRLRENFTIPNHNELLVSIAKDKEAQNTSIALLTKLPKKAFETQSDYKEKLIENIYSALINQRLSEISQKPDASFLAAGTYFMDYFRAKDMVYSYVVPKEGMTELAFESMLIENERVKRYGFTITEVERIKKSILKGYEKSYLERDKTPSSSLVDECVDLFLKQEPMPGIEYEYQLAQKQLPEITLNEINKFATSWQTDSNRVIVVTGPDKDGLNYPSENDLKTIPTKVQNIAKLDPYIDIDENITLMSKSKLIAGKVISETNVNKYGIEKMILSNGATVWLKQTDFKKDEILIAGFSKGGLATIEKDSDFEVLSKTSDIVFVGGLADHKLTTLSKLLAGINVRIRPSIGENTENISGGCSPSDISTAMQLIHLYMTQPGKDSLAFKALLNQFNEELKNKDVDPEQVFGDTVIKILTNNDIRKKPLTAQSIAKLDQKKSLKFYKERFANANDFDFVLVGNFQKDTIKKYLELYIASLPSQKNTKEKWQKIDPQYPKGKINKTIYKGIEPKSRVLLAYSGEFDNTIENRNLADAMVQVLSIRLREQLREDKSGVYGVSCNMSQGINDYKVKISFGCSPNNVDMLIKTANDVVEKMKTDLTVSEQLLKVKEIVKRDHETKIRENGYWLNLIKKSILYNESLEDLLKMSSDFQTITSQQVNQQAVKYLSPTNYVKAILMPEK